ncbi:hypothetical protein D9613_007648 [Agrocybe pediades]|uniref:Uncharacterized protein n=1 Tax=Agrocybe pediades TaxID=84607 RepID=A0A8H4VL42_9AGAR|nr:hypothetical protein D9613_007648 [Agrocybe pediades]
MSSFISAYDSRSMLAHQPYSPQHCFPNIIAGQQGWPCQTLTTSSTVWPYKGTRANKVFESGSNVPWHPLFSFDFDEALVKGDPSNCVPVNRVEGTKTIVFALKESSDIGVNVADYLDHAPELDQNNEPALAKQSGAQITVAIEASLSTCCSSYRPLTLFTL